MRNFMWLFLGALTFMALQTLNLPAQTSHTYKLASIPAEVASHHFIVSINGVETPVVHAAANYYLLSFPIAKKPLTITVTADQSDYWKQGVEVQPWRLGIRPTVNGSKLTFTLNGPAQISITRPHDFLAGAEMLFLFADPIEKDAPPGPGPGIRYIGPGIHHENIDAHTGDRIYLAPGAFLFGSLNLWQVHDVRVWGRGTIIYDGPQNPSDDDGWMHKPNWHCIVMDQAQNISIEGLTCIVRSRTWMIQMKDSQRIRYSYVKVIGGSNGNANQDGMDWLGGGDTVVEDSFFRAADDIFALQGNWDGYSPALMAIPGHDVRNIQIRRTVLSTSISNVVRAAWPHKTFNSDNFSLTDSDVIHAGIGGCVVPFSLLEIWADPDGHGNHTNYRLQNLRLEDWYSLLQLRQPSPAISGIHLDGIFALEQPPLVPSTLLGDVHDVTLQNITLAGSFIHTAANIPIDAVQGADPATISPANQLVDFTVPSRAYRVGQKIHFTAVDPANLKGRTYDWTFGDGGIAHGRAPKHRYKDTGGTLQNGSGRFRVILHATSALGSESWIAHPVMVVDQLQPAVAAHPTQPGLLLQSTLLDATNQSDKMPPEPSTPIVTPTITRDARPASQNYAMRFNGFLDAPADGGYTFLLAANDTGSVRIDGKLLTSSPKPWQQVCGMPGNAVQTAEGTVDLQAGLHSISVEMTHTVGEDGFALYWQTTGKPFTLIPPTALSHDSSLHTP